MTIVSGEQLYGKTLDGQIHLGGVLRTEANRIVLSAQADESFAKSGNVAVVVDGSEEPEDNFKRFAEARFLDHPGVAHAYLSDWVEVNGKKHPYIVLDSPNAVLADTLAEGPLPGTALVDLIRQVLSALAYLHSENLVYGALNVNSIWRQGDRWQLADFSQLRVPGMRPTGETRRLLISREIAAPPEAYYGEITPAWDIWSLGTLLSKIARPVRRNGTEKPQPALTPLPAKLEQIITSAAMLEPQDRMSASEMLLLLTEEKTPLAEPVKTEPVKTVSPNFALPAREMFEPEHVRRFPWVRVAQGAGIGVAVFVVSLFLTRSAVESNSTSPRVEPQPVAAPTPVPVAMPKASLPAPPALKSTDETKLEVAALLGRWADAARQGNLNAQIGCYAPVVDTYFDRHKVSAEDLRHEKEHTLKVSGRLLSFNVSDLRFDATGPGWAVASFENHWVFGGDNPTEGSTREQVVVRSSDAGWKITSERDARQPR